MTTFDYSFLLSSCSAESSWGHPAARMLPRDLGLGVGMGSPGSAWDMEIDGEW
jgi:hypothetical protein